MGAPSDLPCGKEENGFILFSALIEGIGGFIRNHEVSQIREVFIASSNRRTYRTS